MPSDRALKLAMEEVKQVLQAAIPELGEISKRNKVHFRAVMIDFLAKAIHAAHALAKESEGVEAFDADVNKLVQAYQEQEA